MKNLISNEESNGVSYSNPIDVDYKYSDISSQFEKLNETVNSQNSVFSKRIIQLSCSMIKINKKYENVKNYYHEIDKNLLELRKVQEDIEAHEIVTGSNLLIISKSQNIINKEIIDNIKSIYIILKFSIIGNIILSSIFLINLILNIFGG